jgi:hypothetical protein
MALSVANGLHDLFADVEPFSLGDFLPGRRQESGSPLDFFQPWTIDYLPHGQSLAQGLFHQSYPFDEILPPDVTVFGLLQKTDFFNFRVGLGSDHEFRSE